MDSTAQALSARRIDLDWIRIGAFALVILYHVGMLYVSWRFHVKSPHRVPGLEPLMLLLNPWRLALLFVVSGAATRFMTARQAPGALFAQRSRRLLLPLLFGMLVVVPPQSYLEIVARTGWDAGFLAFYAAHYLAFAPQFCDPGPCVIMPTWNHLWFVAYLWVYTALLAGLLAASPGALRRAEAWLLPRLSGLWLLAGPIAILALCRVVLFPLFPPTHALFDDWYDHALYGFAFLFGYLLVPSPAIAAATVRLRWPALMLAAATYAVFIVWRGLLADGAALPAFPGRVAYGAYQWAAIIAILGFAHRHVRRDSPLRRYLTDAIFPYYIVHQTIIIAAAFVLARYAVPAWLEAALIVAATAAGCALAYAMVRRIGWLRPWFGLKPAPARRGPATI